MHSKEFKRDLHMKNNFKQQLQEQEFSALKDEHRVILKWATGCGKSKMTIDLVNNAVKDADSPKKALFVVAERAHINNWQGEFEKWNLRFDKLMTDVCCYASLKKYTSYNYDIIVLDEGHHAFTDKRMAALEELKDSMHEDAYIYLLSATLSSGKQDMLESIFGKFKTSIVTLKEAIEGDVLPDPKVYVIGMELDDTKKHQEIKIGNDPNAPIVKWENRAKYIYKHTPCIITCTELQKYTYLTSSMEYWKQRYEISHSEFQRTKWVNLGSQRKRFLGELKTGAIRKMIEKLPKDNRFVCFCASVAQAGALNLANTVSSKRPMKSNQLIIDKFNNKQINSIYAVGMITEGMNLKDIQTGIIVQLDGKERLFIQKFGRALRAEDPTCYIFYYKNTQDENYLKSALENIDSKFIKYCNSTEICHQLIKNK